LIACLKLVAASLGNLEPTVRLEFLDDSRLFTNGGLFMEHTPDKLFARAWGFSYPQSKGSGIA
jgi:hypothetical protein